MKSTHETLNEVEEALRIGIGRVEHLARYNDEAITICQMRQAYNSLREWRGREPRYTPGPQGDEGRGWPLVRDTNVWDNEVEWD